MAHDILHLCCHAQVGLLLFWWRSFLPRGEAHTQARKIKSSWILNNAKRLRRRGKRRSIGRKERYYTIDAISMETACCACVSGWDFPLQLLLLDRVNKLAQFLRPVDINWDKGPPPSQLPLTPGWSQSSLHLWNYLPTKVCTTYLHRSRGR